MGVADEAVGCMAASMHQAGNGFPDTRVVSGLLRRDPPRQLERVHRALVVAGQEPCPRCVDVMVAYPIRRIARGHTDELGELGCVAVVAEFHLDGRCVDRDIRCAERHRAGVAGCQIVAGHLTAKHIRQVPGFGDFSSCGVRIALTRRENGGTQSQIAGRAYGYRISRTDACVDVGKGGLDDPVAKLVAACGERRVRTHVAIGRNLVGIATSRCGEIHAGEEQ